MVLHTALLKIFRVSADGSEQLIRVLGPGDFTGETSVFTGQRPDDYATALDDCQLCMFRHDDLEALIRKHPEISLRLLATVSARLSDTEHRLSSLTSRNVEGRLADYLIGLPAPDGAALPPRTSRWPRRTWPPARHHPESFSRALKSLARAV